MDDLEEFGVVLAERIHLAIETIGPVMSSDEDVHSAINALVEVILEKYSEIEPEEEDSDIELHGDMDQFPE